MSDVVIIGGGVVGWSAAYDLAVNGARVTVVESGAPGQATAAGAGIISPGTGFPPDSPLYPLARDAMAYYLDLLRRLAADGEDDVGYEQVGSIVVITEEVQRSALSMLARTAEHARRDGMGHIGTVSSLPADSARALFPVLGDVREAVHFSGAARIDGQKILESLRRAAIRRGASMRQGTAVPVRHGDRIVRIDLEDRPLPVGNLLVAAGAWTGRIGEETGVALPVYPQRGQLLHFELPGHDTGPWPIVQGPWAHYLLTFPRSRVVVGATHEDAGYDPRPTARGVGEVLNSALAIAPGLADATLAEIRVGLRPVTPDGLPLLGQVPGITNLFVAAGHGASGLQLGPHSGAMVASLLQGTPLPRELAGFSPERFASQR